MHWHLEIPVLHERVTGQEVEPGVLAVPHANIASGQPGHFDTVVICRTPGAPLPDRARQPIRFRHVTHPTQDRRRKHIEPPMAIQGTQAAIGLCLCLAFCPVRETSRPQRPNRPH